MENMSPLAAFGIFVNEIAVVKAEKHDWKKNTQKEYNYMYEITENIDNDKLNITYLLFGSLSPCFKQKNWKWYFTVDCLSECCNYRLQTCVKVLLRTFARKFSNIDFFLKILPLKDDELVMSEM